MKYKSISLPNGKLSVGGSVTYINCNIILLYFNHSTSPDSAHIGCGVIPAVTGGYNPQFAVVTFGNSVKTIRFQRSTNYGFKYMEASDNTMAIYEFICCI